MNSADTPESDSPPPPPRPTFETLIGRALKLRCPRCGIGPLYRTWIKMHQKCPHCGLVFDRAPGYFLGAAYINYGLTAVTMTGMFLLARLVFQVPTRDIIWPAFGFCVAFPLVMFRHARAMWLALDCHFDTSVLSSDTSDSSGK